MTIKNLDNFAEMNSQKNIVPKMIMCHGELYERMPLGYFKKNAADELDVCPQCGCKKGELHHIGCSHEICPICEGLLAICSCKSVIV